MWLVLPLAAVFEIAWWLITGELSDEPRKMIVRWLFLAISVGAVEGVGEWKAKEKSYQGTDED